MMQSENRSAIKTVLRAMAVLAACASGSAALDARAQDDLRAREEAAVRAAVALVGPSVVRIETIGGLERVEQMVLGEGPTTGLVVHEDGFIVSSAFNFIRQPSSILVYLPDGTRAAARVVARDESRRLVLLKAEFNGPLPVPAAVPRDAVRAGAWSIAVGRTLDPKVPNLSVGVISAVDRIWGKAIQTDAKISPSNYGGPLIDIHGRVLGVLVPLSPQSQDEVAGVEWYDSGIGFAVPLVDILARLDRWKEGNDLVPGILGISLKGDNDYVDPPIVEIVRVNSPAGKSGVRKGDRIAKIDGRPTDRVAQLKHVLGRAYAGDSVELELARGDETVRVSVQLTDTLIPYAHAYLGVLPPRVSSGAPGVAAFHVFPDSPAAKAGIRPGDLLVACDGVELTDTASLRAQLAQHPPGDTIAVRCVRGTETLDIACALSPVSESLPESLPEIAAPIGLPPEERPSVGKLPIRIPEQANTCSAYVPEDLDPRESFGLLVWLHAPGDPDTDAPIVAWKEHCRKHRFILLLPRAHDESGWRMTEAEFIRKSIEQVRTAYRIDRERIAVGGSQTGAAMACMIGLTQRDLVRGIVMHEAALPARIRLPDNEPSLRLQLLISSRNRSRIAAAVEEGIAALRERRFPVTVLSIADDAPREVSDGQRSDIARWLGALDRL
ncbi:MAG: PDZ domain-containing protein [Planctomycetes bacterium]|nr:PDZ domain-containing protein [Planctomycetota bacterium]